MTDVCACMHVPTSMGAHVQACTLCVRSYTWRPTTEVNYLPQSLSILFSEAGSLANCRRQGFSESSRSVCSEDHLSVPPEGCGYRQATMPTQV